MPGPSEGERSFLLDLERLLQRMLQTMRYQRRCLIEGNLKGVESSNRLLGALVESQRELQAGGPSPEEAADHHALARVRQLADQLQRESRTNYLLACRGAELTRLSLSLLTDSLHGPARSKSLCRALDRPA
jgi:hypothetical protein